MLESPPTLKRVTIDFDRQRVLDITPDLQTFIEMGLDVTLTHLPTLPSSKISPWDGLADAPLPIWNPSEWSHPPPITLPHW
ncbi:hypothetical protein K438DRAFT_1880999 [Mycena galopus ATCC 62051]|nr:hypothetical protein K438DRAFT_1880999 [Mycena galopus ATCC 62051]